MFSAWNIQLWRGCGTWEMGNSERKFGLERKGLEAMGIKVVIKVGYLFLQQSWRQIFLLLFSEEESKVWRAQTPFSTSVTHWWTQGFWPLHFHCHHWFRVNVQFLMIWLYCSCRIFFTSENLENTPVYPRNSLGEMSLVIAQKVLFGG